MTKIWLNSDTPGDAFPLYSDRIVPPKRQGIIRIWIDGCFDMLHYGHSNVLSQASLLGHEIFAGSHEQEEILKYKGTTIMTAKERYDALRANKFVTFVVENYPYVTRLKDMIRFGIDFVIHGDDITYDSNGNNSYQNY